MRKKIYTTLFAAVIGGMALTGCIDEVTPQTNYVTGDQASAAPGAFDNFVDNLTGNLAGKFTYSGSDHDVYDFGYPAFYLTRDVEGMDIVAQGGNNWFDTWYQNFTYLSPGWAICQLPMTYYFGWIKDCNNVISMAGASDYSEPESDRAIGAGIAYAMRAMYYLDLTRCYAAEPYVVNPNALTIMKVTETTTMEKAMNNPRMTWNEAIEFILKDLDRAETLLADYNRSDVYTPNVNVVYGLKARTYLEARDWENAEKYAKMAQHGYSMMTRDEYLSRDYGFNSPNSSWIFGLTFKSTDPCILENDGDSSWGSVMCQENGFECGYAANYGGPNTIDRHLYETIPATDFRKNCWIDFGIDDMEEEDAMNALEAYSYYPERLLASGVASGCGVGGVSLKFRNAAGKADIKYDAWVVAVPMMRIEEMKLIEAEAAGMQEEERGIQLLTAFATTRDENYVYGTHNEAYYNNSSTVFQNEIWWQRRVELWGEGFSMFDIKRFNKGIIRSYAGTNHVEGSRFNVETIPNWMNWCIGGTDNDYNKGLVNNPNPTRPGSDSPEFVW